MNWFKENNCRLCKKVFCCKKCREGHENSVHKIFSECNICLYGKSFLKEPSENLINHIKSRHLPLHCKFCKKFFGSYEEFLKCNKCTIGYKNIDGQKSPYTPNQAGSENNYESPPYLFKGQEILNTNMFCNLATSTPLQREENDLSEKCNQNIVITPVDCSDINKEKKSFDDCVSLKRKVTFCETPMPDSNRKQKNESSDGKFEDHVIIITPSSGSSSAFYTAKQYLQDNLTPQEEKNENNTTDEKVQTDGNKNEEMAEVKEDEAKQDDGTLWISAINLSTSDTEENKPTLEINSTPVITKAKKRQINVVMPTAVRKKDIAESEQNVPVILEELKNNSRNALSDISSTEILSDSSIKTPGRLWISVSRLVKNVTHVVQGFSVNRTSVKRPILDCDRLEGPHVKRYKLTEIKCRPPIRALAGIEYSGEYRYTKFTSRSISSNISREASKIFVDKATQTEESDFI